MKTFFILLFILIFISSNIFSADLKDSNIFIIYNGTATYFLGNITTYQKLLYIQIVNSTYQNGTSLVCNILVSLNISMAPYPSCNIENSTSPYTFYYINPKYLGRNINQYIYVSYENDSYVYKREGYINGVTIIMYFYFNQKGIAERVVNIQYGFEGKLVSVTEYKLWLTNLYENVTFPKLNFTITGTIITLTTNIIKTIYEIIIGIGSLGVIVILLLRDIKL
jgi:hypothetical protein